MVSEGAGMQGQTDRQPKGSKRDKIKIKEEGERERDPTDLNRKGKKK